MTDKPQPKQDEKTGRFIAGNGGNGGRPKGSRNKLGEAFLNDLYANWQQHGVETIETVREDNPEVYLKVVASILPKDLNVNINPLEEAKDEELIQRLRELDSIIRPFLGAQGGSEDSCGVGSQTAH